MLNLKTASTVLAIAALAAAWTAIPAKLGQAADAKFTLQLAGDEGWRLHARRNMSATIRRNCSGQNVSLPLAWANAPAATKSFAITMFDPVPGAGLGFVHWVVYDIPATRTSLAEGEGNNPSAFVGGKNSVGSSVWFGPCPALTDAPHPYTITLIATDIPPGTLQPGMTRDQLIAALQGHALGVTTFIARYPKP